MNMTAEASPIYKAIRDLEQADIDMVLKVLAILPRIKESGTTIEVRAVRHDGWRIATVRRQAVDLEP